MRRDLVYLLIDEGEVHPFGNLKTLLETVHLEGKYSTIWRLLEKGDGEAEYGPYIIQRRPVIRAPFTIGQK